MIEIVTIQPIGSKKYGTKIRDNQNDIYNEQFNTRFESFISV